jgi:putative sterol carrier protein
MIVMNSFWTRFGQTYWGYLPTWAEQQNPMKTISKYHSTEEKAPSEQLQLRLALCDTIIRFVTKITQPEFEINMEKSKLKIIFKGQLNNVRAKLQKKKIKMNSFFIKENIFFSKSFPF